MTRRPVSALFAALAIVALVGTAHAAPAAVDAGQYSAISKPVLPPTPQPDFAATTVGVPVTIPVLANDVDVPTSLPLRIASFAQPLPSTGTVVQIGNELQYTPFPGFQGTGTFTYIVANASGLLSFPTPVTVTVTASAIPVAANDSASTGLGSPVTIDVLANDAGNQPLVVAAVTQPAHGTVVPSGTLLTYRPHLGFFGLDSFTYQDRDPFHVPSNFATVTVRVVKGQLLRATAVATVTGTSVLWNVTGTTNITVRNKITISVVTKAGLKLLGRVRPDATGAWTLSVTRSILPPAVNPRVRVTSSLKKSITVPVTVQ